MPVRRAMERLPRPGKLLARLPFHSAMHATGSCTISAVVFVAFGNTGRSQTSASRRSDRPVPYGRSGHVVFTLAGITQPLQRCTGQIDRTCPLRLFYLLFSIARSVRSHSEPVIADPGTCVECGGESPAIIFQQRRRAFADPKR